MDLQLNNQHDTLPELFAHEIEGWKHILETIMEENSFLKNKLGALLKVATYDPEFLGNAEYFQNKFLKQDETIAFLRKDIEEQIRTLVPIKLVDSNNRTNIIRTQQQLRTDMESTETDFNNLLFEFNNFLALTLTK